MAEAGSYPATLDPGVDYVFNATFDDDGGGPIDLSSLTFNFILKFNLNNTTTWDVTDGQMSRPAINEITFTKYAAEIAAMRPGNYTMSLLVTGSAFIDGGTRTFVNDEWINGTFRR